MQKVKIRFITDMHIPDSNPSTRVDFVEEVKKIFNDTVIDPVSADFEAGYTPVVVFLGDVFDRALNDLEQRDYWHQVFSSLSGVAHIYSVVGNHELTYYKNNLFWSLVKKIESNTLLASHKVSAKAIVECIKIVDVLNIGPLQVTFQHYGSKILDVPSDQYRVLVTHNSYMHPAIKKVMEDKYGIDTLSEYIHYNEIPEIFKSFRKIYNGHMHMANCVFQIDGGTELAYLGSHGRTKHNEVSNNFLRRMIPVITVEDGEVKEEIVEYVLPTREESVREEIVFENTEKRESKKEARAHILVKGKRGEDPVERIKDRFVHAAPVLLRFESLIRKVQFSETSQLLYEGEE